MPISSSCGAVVLAVLCTAAAAQPSLPTTAAAQGAAARRASFDGVIEAVRQTVVASQVAGSVVALDVRAGDRVRQGQVLLRIDARTARQDVAASEAQVQAARASLEVATREFERQTQLFHRQYISRTAFERAEAQFKATQAQVAAQLAQAGAARIQTEYFAVKAPYAGAVAEVPVAQGDMALPGRPLLTLYDPRALRVTVAVPQSLLPDLATDAGIELELPGRADGRIRVAREQVTILPTADPATHTVQVRLELPAGLTGLKPGLFARAWIPTRSLGTRRVHVPAKAVVQRGELTGVYVLATSGRPILRQVRLGRPAGETVEVLAGVAFGERVVLDPQAAARAGHDVR
ncbi:efflux RND transporter periplasmic adaptor subunit [Aquabacterium sp. A7-Y]|uniref:efflux RND transporter periplasmic adaptor subunit n=1 Tax=Aquabacterium sp. A7-Y TaxID=1349605 RepID=UPI00223D2BB6|nr:efflux RND transporter periplasmic adaptor subunit [Aquabacterium sp. A7-Y]MCW7541395.1 efflux RND transporter periplasmic adaptor subunit [Aquabacterium sp. A7-Y]